VTREAWSAGTRVAVPEPDAKGIYAFPTALWRAHAGRQHELRALDGRHVACASLTPPLGERAPLHPTGSIAHLVPVQGFSGEPIIALEPHHDDVVLSISGTLLATRRPARVVTVFTDTESARPEVAASAKSGQLTISALREQESAAALSVIAVERRTLGLADARPPYEARTSGFTTRLAEMISVAIDGWVGELFAPAAVTRHPDHLAVHEAARMLGCRSFWDDTAFWPTYGANVDDRMLFALRTGGALDIEHVDITAHVLDKLTLLLMYQSQMSPIEMYRPLRYNWTVAREARAGARAMRFAERLHRER
jgi:LmbE family N-acetylglucosaminyl deacetylase